MGLSDWIKQLFKGNTARRSDGGAGTPDGIPEIIGECVDKNGNKQTFYRGPLQHESLSADQLQRIARLRDVLLEVYPMTLDGWVDGFLRDTNPESEIQILEACAFVYQQLVGEVSLTHEQRRKLYALLCAISASGPDPELESGRPEAAGMPDLITIAERYREARQTGRRP